MPESTPRQAMMALLARLGQTARQGRPALVRQIIPLLSDQNLPAHMRISAAARILRFIPDRSLPVRRVLKALTAGLTRQKSLEYLRGVQHLVPKCDTLDLLISYRERKLRLICPVCRMRLARSDMIQHLWHSHQLIFVRGRTLTLARAIDKFRKRHSKSGDPQAIDQAVAFAGAAGLRQLLARDDSSAEEMIPLLADAAGRGVGLCPGCFAELPATIQEMPPPLGLGKDRLSGDGFAIELRGNAWYRGLKITVPDRQTSIGKRFLTPRAAAALLAATLLSATLLIGPAVEFAVAGLLLAAVIYLVVRSLAARAVNRQDEIIETTWHRVVPRYAERKLAARFLTRLCLSSQGRGDPLPRARAVTWIIERARQRCKESDQEMQLFAAAGVLRVEDAARYGRDIAAGIAALAGQGFAGDRPADFSEYVLASYFAREREAGEIARLRILLAVEAFEAGLVPRALLDLWAGAPNLKRAMAMEPPAHRLGLLFAVWRKREAQPWWGIGQAETVFDLAQNSPTSSVRYLARYPDLLLLHRPMPLVEELLGPLFICCRGVAIGSRLVADPYSPLNLEPDGRTLIFGPHRIEVAGRLPQEFVAVIRQWLRFRAEILLPLIDGCLEASVSEQTAHVLTPFSRKCLRCGSVSIVSPGQIGRKIEF